MSISGTEARILLRDKKAIPPWYMRPKISKMILKSINAKEDVFVK